MANPYDFVNEIEQSSTIHLKFNYSPIFDLLNGIYIKGKHDAWYLLGGNPAHSFICGGNNTNKTGMVVERVAAILYRIADTIIYYHDTESTLDVYRLGRRIDELFGIENYFNDRILGKRFIYHCKSDGKDGNDLNNFIKKAYAAYKENKNKKEFYQDSPFIDKDGKAVKFFTPLVIVGDSMSELDFKVINDEYMLKDLGTGGKQRMRDMEIGNAKRILMEDADTLCSQSGASIIWTCQTSDIINIDGKPLEKESTFLRQGKKLSKTPKAMMRIPQIGMEIIKGTSLKNNDGTWLYPNPKGRDIAIDSDGKENPDLMEYIYEITRCKSGKSGGRGTFISSQSEGFKEGLSMYHTLKTHKYFGMTQTGRSAHIVDLLPDLSLERTTIWFLTDNTPQLHRALTISYQMWYMQKYWLNLPDEFRITPNDLYKLINERGLDWNDILSNTVDYFFTSPEIKKHTVTTYELLDVAVNKKDPYWLTTKNKK